MGEQPWESIDQHLAHAFEYANKLGRSGVARVLLERIADRSTAPRLPEYPLLPAPSPGNPAKLAAHDRQVAFAVDRDIRAAALLDPDISLDSILLGQDLPE
ncbi:hypothetical protein HDC37_001362 [Microbacterium sp. AK009]|uniref:hypothetical protein n=1 Tax=Microbacterium sp. AK009 TaxID=2723068 RepID=UPI0015CA3190|nr:hypothetical protein [Microbacterium sp. AK009]NYF16537.1 hypothetical protein [Microbacterium sp. AK009]